MKRVECSYCKGKKEIKMVREEALERAVSDFFQLDNEPCEIYYHPCPRCNGSGMEFEVELKDFCRIQSC